MVDVEPNCKYCQESLYGMFNNKCRTCVVNKAGEDNNFDYSEELHQKFKEYDAEKN